MTGPTGIPDMTAPDASAKPGHRGQLDVLARQMLAQRSGLEAIRLQAGFDAAIVAQVDALLDQLDAAFAILGVLQLGADMTEAASTIETPEEAGPPKVPNTFGAKRRAGTQPEVTNNAG